MKPETLEFDAARHVYTLAGEELPSVTTLIKRAGLIDSTWFKAEATQRGSDVHAITELHDLGELDESKVEAEIAGYLDGWKDFLAARRWRTEAIEERVWSRGLGLAYAGTLDRRGSWDGVPAVLDIKTWAFEASWHRLQLAAYALTFEGGAQFRRVVVYLRPDRKYKVRVCEDQTDIGAWMNLIQFMAWRARNGD